MTSHLIPSALLMVMVGSLFAPAQGTTTTPSRTATRTCTPQSINTCRQNETITCTDSPCLRCACITQTPTPPATTTPTVRSTPVRPQCDLDEELVCETASCPTGCCCTTPIPTPTATASAACPDPATPLACASSEITLCADYSCGSGCSCACAGDCDRSHAVTIDELVTAVGMALAGTPSTACLAAVCDCHPGAPCAALVTIDCLVKSVGSALEGCPGAAPTPVATPTETRAPLVCEGCAPDGSCSADINGVRYTGTCGDGQIIDGTCYRGCDWNIPPEVCGGDACESGDLCLTMWHGLVVDGRCQDCSCVFDPGTPTRTSTPTPTGQTPISPTPTVPPALERAITFVCGGSEYERTFGVGETGFFATCYGFEHGFVATMREFAAFASASRALDELRDRGIAVPFRGGEAVTWSEQYGPERSVYYAWAEGCWLVQVRAEKNLGSPRSVSPLGLAEAIDAFAAEEGLFETCLETPTPRLIQRATTHAGAGH